MYVLHANAGWPVVADTSTVPNAVRLCHAREPIMQVVYLYLSMPRAIGSDMSSIGHECTCLVA